MPEKKSLVPTFTCAVGMLFGGLGGAALGLLGKNETAVVGGFVVGCLLGSIIGSLIGLRWVQKKQLSQCESREENSTSE